MKRRIAGMSMAVMSIVQGCRYGPVEMDRQLNGTRQEWTGGGTERPGETGNPDDGNPETPKELYITGVEYPEGYDWRHSIGTNDDIGKLFLMKGKERIMELPVGQGNCISSDADMHRCIGGHLYTDFSTDTETVIKCDGTERFRYSGREMIADMAVITGEVHTLGMPRSGNGLTYRINGNIIIHKRNAVLMSGFHQSGKELFFSCVEPSGSSAGAPAEYYIIRNGTENMIQPPADAIGIDDARIIDGKLCMTARMRWGTAYSFIQGSHTTPYQIRNGYSISGCRIIYGGGNIFTFGEAISGYRQEGWIWSNGYIVASTDGMTKSCGVCADRENIYMISNPATDDAVATIYDGSRSVSLPAGYGCIYNDGIGSHNGHCCAIISNRYAGNKPALWEDGVITEHSFNGCFTSVSFW